MQFQEEGCNARLHLESQEGAHGCVDFCRVFLQTSPLVLDVPSQQDPRAALVQDSRWEGTAPCSVMRTPENGATAQQGGS